jgi:hypothetical protein
VEFATLRSICVSQTHLVFRLICTETAFFDSNKVNFKISGLKFTLFHLLHVHVYSICVKLFFICFMSNVYFCNRRPLGHITHMNHYYCVNNLSYWWFWCICGTDIDECSEQQGVCSNGQCFNTPGSYRCRCNRGYRLSSSGQCTGTACYKEGLNIPNFDVAFWKIISNQFKSEFITL